MDDERNVVRSAFDVSRETFARLDLIVTELARWQKIQNLVGAKTLPRVWLRHVADSLQLPALAPEALRWLDLGSGAGFPGLVVAAALAERSGARVDLVESNSRKCAFLRHVARTARLPAVVHEARIETTVRGLPGPVDVVTARALAPLSQLLLWTAELLEGGAIGLFPKGKTAPAELTEAAKSSRLGFDLIPSRVDPEGWIVRATSLNERR
jgi:16S rRNA (guanine527-N7)-methyltransferase